MERMTSKLTGAFVVLLLFAAAAPITNSQEQRKVRRASGVETAIDKLGAGAASNKTNGGLPRVPDVVGLIFTDAESALRLAGFEPKLTFQDEPDSSVTYGHVRATVPAAGTLAAGGEVELQIPRAASRVGIGALSLSDVERRDGFDLDEARYEEIFRGADIVLRKYENGPRVDENGRTYYAGGGLYIEPSDGAVLASLNDVRDIDQYGLGSALFYVACESALKQTRSARVKISPPSDGPTTICVLTSKHQIAVVQFRNSDNPYLAVTDYKFHHAIFPRQLVRTDRINITSDYPYVIEKAIDVNALAAKGEGIANADPLAAELRNREPEGPSRRGFDIGMAAAEGQTLPGPGKQRIHDSLSPAEQGGFDTAVSFSLERNRNAALAAKGAAIAAADSIVAEARIAEADVFYWLGFDIATGIFGDPALGAQGNTATGPGSLKIRDSLSAAGQRGFNASVTLHLSRNYRP